MNEKKPQKVHTLFHSGICKILDDLLQVFTTGLKTVTKPTRNKKKGIYPKKAVRSPCFLITIHRLISSNHPRKKNLNPPSLGFLGLEPVLSEIWSLHKTGKNEIFHHLLPLYWIGIGISSSMGCLSRCDNNIMTISSPLYNFRFWSVTPREIELDSNLRAHKSVSKNSFQICLKLENPHDDFKIKILGFLTCLMKLFFRFHLFCENKKETLFSKISDIYRKVVTNVLQINTSLQNL